ncbi:hypothetical protein [Salicibibacter kimchii]|uniref:Uncharacterized protein n=1 Tax=Salicibibacter kimchii TaxID=2099786 RepID=A0A345BYK9_9BACI|nr:hypothetical protein [Salicibibacter kimchii]AXF56040.1 hypothetical protein DT065_08380 [Salicibibacter kimchii]
MVTLIPVPFLFHFYETLQFARGEDVPFLLLSVLLLLFIIFIGAVSTNIKLRNMILVSIVSIIISVLLGTVFITPLNEAWFKPFGRGLTLMFTGIALFVGQFYRSFYFTLFESKSVTNTSAIGVREWNNNCATFAFSSLY